MTRSATALEAALDERQKLERNARLARKRDLERLYADPEYGLRFRAFVATLGHFQRLEQGAQMVAYIRKEIATWLAAAPEKFRHAALSAVDDRIMAIRIKAGLPAIDDPLPGEPDSVFRICKREMGL